MAKTARQKITKKLDDIVSEIIRERDKKCVMCGSTERLQNGHVFSRRHDFLKWDIRPDGNCHTQCATHNYLHSQKDSYPYWKWYQDKFGMERFNELRREWETIAHFKMYDLREKYEKLKNYKPTLTVRGRVSGKIVKRPTPEEVKISKEREIDFSLQARLKKHEEVSKEKL